jgi:tetratricopeptide (TPR) repeat protein
MISGDTARFRRYLTVIERSAPERGRLWRTISRAVWGPLPPDSAIRSLRGHDVGELISGLHGLFANPAASSDTVLDRFHWAIAALPPSQEARTESLREIGKMYAGLGQMERARAYSDTLRKEARSGAPTLLAWPMALGLAPPDFDRGYLDSAVAAVPAGPGREYARAMLALLRGRADEARKAIDELASRDDPGTPDELRGEILAAQGRLVLLAGDTTAGIRRMQEGIDLAARPRFAADLGIYRFELAAAMASRPDTRAEGIRRLANGFMLEPLFIPLGYFTLGRAYEAAGRRDSAAMAYGRFIRLWDRADPPLQGRVDEAREALKRLTAEPR